MWTPTHSQKMFVHACQSLFSFCLYFWLHVRAICNQTLYLSVVVHWQKHLDCCLLLVVSCTNENCKETMVRKNLDEHVTVTCQWRMIHCSYCSVSLPDCYLKVKSHIVLLICFLHSLISQSEKIKTRLSNNNTKKKTRNKKGRKRNELLVTCITIIIMVIAEKKFDTLEFILVKQCHMSFH